MRARWAGRGTQVLVLVALLAAALGFPTTALGAISTTLSIVADPNPAWSDELVTVTVTVTPNPGGGWVFMNRGDYPVDPATGQATFTKAFDIAGSREVTATFLGFGSYAPSDPTTIFVEVDDHPVELTLQVPEEVGRGDPFEVTIEADESPTPGHGFIQVRDMTLGGTGFFLGSVATSGESPMTLELPGMLPGAYKLQASYAGGLHFEAATSALVDLTVFDRPTTTTMTATPDPSKWGEEVHLFIQVEPHTAEGNLVVKVDGSVVATPTLTPNGVAHLDVVPGAPGAHTITAEFGSQANPSPPEPWAPSSDSESHTVSTTPVETTPPTGTVSINDGASTATSIPVGLTMTGSDASGVAWTDISNDGVTWYSHPANLAEYGWNLADPDYGGEATDGTKTVYVRWRDLYGNTSTTATDTIWLDFFGPIGTASVMGGAAYTGSTAVSVNVAATDVGSSVSQVSLSNDGTSWTTFAYAPSVAWTLPATNGTRTVHVKWKDATGNWSEVKTDTIILDTVAPTATAPGKVFAGGATVNGGLAPVKLSWTGSDATSGIARYEAALKTDAGAYSTLSTSLTSATLTRGLAPGHTYRLRVRPVDKAGRVGAWVEGASFRVSSFQEGSGSIVRTGTWSLASSSSYWGGAERRASGAGASARITFTGRAFAWVGTVSPSSGSAKVYVNGALVKTVSLYNASTAYRRVVVQLSWATSASRTVRIVVSGTAGHPRVSVDAFLTGT